MAVKEVDGQDLVTDERDRAGGPGKEMVADSQVGGKKLELRKVGRQAGLGESSGIHQEGRDAVEEGESRGRRARAQAPTEDTVGDGQGTK